MKQAIFWAVLTVLVAGAVEGLSALGLEALHSFRGARYTPIEKDKLSASHTETVQQLIAGKNHYIVIDSILGWTLGKAADGRNGKYHTNARGARSTREYAQNAPAGLIRILCFGDSFTHCDEVADGETWQDQLERLQSSFEVINFGVPGYGIDQAYLRYQKDGGIYRGATYVLIGFMSENINRSVNVFRPFYSPETGLPLAKPRFRLKDQEANLLPNPLPSVESYRRLLGHPDLVLPALGEEDHFYSAGYTSGSFDAFATVRLGKMLWFKLARAEDIHDFSGKYVPHSEALRTSLWVLRKFYAAVEDSGMTPLIVLFPNESDVTYSQRHGLPPYQVLKDSLDSYNLECLDLISHFSTGNQSGGASPLFSGHYTANGNGVVARALRLALSRKPDNLPPSGEHP